MTLMTGRFARETGVNVVTASMWFHVGANMDQRLRVHIGTMTAQGLGIQSPDGLPHTASFISLSNPDAANTAIGVLDSALRRINKQRADLGAYQNRLEHARRGLAVGAENLQASESRIRDADMAAQTVRFVTNQILLQASTAMLAQANQVPQTVLGLLQ
jgi:flagellin